MPTRASRVCQHAQCGQLCAGRYCTLHVDQINKKAIEYDDKRGSSHARGYSSRGEWMRLRKMCLARDPLCKIAYRTICNGFAPSTVADHIVAKNAGGENSIDNLQGCCQRCHDRKTRLVDVPAIRVHRSQLLATARSGRGDRGVSSANAMAPQTVALGP